MLVICIDENYLEIMENITTPEDLKSLEHRNPILKIDQRKYHNPDVWKIAMKMMDEKIDKYKKFRNEETKD